MEATSWWSKIEDRFLPAHAQQVEPLILWRERILMVLCLTVVVVAPLALVPSLLLAYQAERTDIMVLDIAAYATAFFILILKNRSLKIRLWLGYAMFYILGVGLLIMVGPFGAGYIWLFGASVIAGAFLGFRMAILAVFYNLLALSFIGVLIFFRLLPWAELIEQALDIWVIMVANFMIVDTLITVAVAVMLRGLETSLVSEKRVSDELRDISDKSRLIFQNATEGILVIQDGRIKFLNRQVADLLESEVEELQENAELSFLEWVYPADRKMVAQRYMLRQMGEEVPSQYQIRIAGLDGKPIWVEISSTIITWEDHTATLAFLKDIAERKKAEDLLRESEQRFKEMANLLPTIIVEVVPDGRITYSNQAGFDTFGIDQENLEEGLHFSSLIHDDDLADMSDLFEQVFQTDRYPAGGEYRFKRKNDQSITCFMQVRPIRYQGRTTGIRASLMDITEMKRAQRDLEISEEKHRSIVESIQEGYFETDLSGAITFSNQGFRDMLGYVEPELKGKDYRLFFHPDSLDEALYHFRTIYEKGLSVKAADWVLVRKDGSPCHVETSLSSIQDYHGYPTGFRAVCRDVTERKKLLQVQQQSIRAEAASQAKTEFLARMSHEIRTPLNAIVGMTELALEEVLSERQKKILDTINSESLALMTLVNRILDFSKIEAQRLDLENIPFELGYLLEDISDSTAVEAHKKKLEMILYIPLDIPTRLIGDPGRLRQVLKNLLGNAVKFTEVGEVFLTVALLEQSENQVLLQFSIKDTGIGIPESQQLAIFDAFTQADGSTTRFYGGTGLGTTISKKLVELMGGEITLESGENGGSTFRFTGRFGLQTTSFQENLIPAASLSGRRVLLVNNNQTFRQVLSSYLESWGCVVYQADFDDLDERFTEMTADEAVSLIISDLPIGRNDECDTAGDIRHRIGLEHVPLVVLVEMGRLGDGLRCRELGVQGYLAKPVRRDDLMQIVRVVLGEIEPQGPQCQLPLVTRHLVSEWERSRFNILLAEDYPTNQVIATEHLSGQGFRVEMAANGEEAVSAFQRRRFDLILMDIQMPVMDGYEATRRIRKIEERLDGLDRSQRVPIVAMTAHAFKGYRQKCLDAGMDDYITKPFLRKELLDMVDKWSYHVRQSREEAINGDWVGIPAADEATDPLLGLGAGDDHDRPMDFERVLNEFLGKEDLVKRTIEHFIEMVDRQIEVIRQALVENQPQTVTAESHAIKGGAANLAAGSLADSARNLEQAAASGRMEQGLELLNDLEAAFSELKSYVDANKLI